MPFSRLPTRQLHHSAGLAPSARIPRRGVSTYSIFRPLSGEIKGLGGYEFPAIEPGLSTLVMRFAPNDGDMKTGGTQTEADKFRQWVPFPLPAGYRSLGACRPEEERK